MQGKKKKLKYNVEFKKTYIYILYNQIARGDAFET